MDQGTTNPQQGKQIKDFFNVLAKDNATLSRTEEGPSTPAALNFGTPERPSSNTKTVAKTPRKRKNEDSAASNGAPEGTPRKAKDVQRVRRNICKGEEPERPDFFDSKEPGPAQYEEDQHIYDHCYPDCTEWCPSSPYSLCREPKKKHYKKFQCISRIIHFDDYLDGYQYEKLFSYSLIKPWHRTYLKEGTKGLWFEAENLAKKEGSHNWYGNVKYKIDLKLFEELFLKEESKYKVYFLNVNEYKTMTSTRLLVASPEDAIFANKKLEEYRCETWGGPWCKDDQGENWRLTHIRKFKTHEPHTGQNLVEFFLRLSEEDAQTLLERSSILPAAHTYSNMLKIDREKPSVDEMYHMCHKYRSGNKSNWKWCPSAWPLTDTKVLMEMMEGITELSDRAALCIMLQVVPELIRMIEISVTDSKMRGRFVNMKSSMMKKIDSCTNREMIIQHIKKNRRQESRLMLQFQIEGVKQEVVKTEDTEENNIQEENIKYIKQEDMEEVAATATSVEKRVEDIKLLMKQYINQELSELQELEGYGAEREQLQTLVGDDRQLAIIDRSERIKERVEKWMFHVAKDICQLCEE